MNVIVKELFMVGHAMPERRALMIAAAIARMATASAAKIRI